MTAIISVWVCILLFVCWFITIYKTDKRHNYSIVSFGDLPESTESASSEKKEILFDAYLKQQRYAFALLLSTLVIAVVLIGILIGRLVLTPTIDIETILSVLGFGSDIILSRGAFKLYKSSSARIEKLLK